MAVNPGAVNERRAARRYLRAEEHGILVARIRPGHPAMIVEISSVGGLIETARRMAPDGRLELQLERGIDRLCIRARVVRAFVARIAAGGIAYRGALAFDDPLTWLPE